MVPRQGSTLRATLLKALILPGWLGVIALAPVSTAQAEGGWQLGLFEGVSHRQPLNTATVMNIDILAPGEVINMHVCGSANDDDVRVQLTSPAGTIVFDETLTEGNVDCNSSFDGPDVPWDPSLTEPLQYTVPASGSYTLRSAAAGGVPLDRWDVTVTDDLADPIDPRLDQGRLWSTRWIHDARTYAEANSTDADLYVVANGGFVNTFAIWQLDLNNFAGFVYQLRANNKGVRSPNAAGDVVAGISVPRAGNAIDPQYPIYVAYPAKNFPGIDDIVIAENFRFVDDQGQDAVISPGVSGAEQDEGSFSFDTNIDTDEGAVYEIIIDIDDGTGGGPDDVFGPGDVFLVDDANSGANTVVWDGRDNSGDVVPEGFYSARLRVRIGEFHFVADDVETSGGTERGIRINEARSRTSTSPAIVYWDDFSVLGSTRQNAFNVDGLFDGDHVWGNYTANGFGNERLIDTYAFSQASEPLVLNIGIASDDIARPSVEKSFLPGTVTAGTPSTMRIAITNNNADDLTGISLSDALPSGMTIASDPAAVVATGSGCAGFTVDPATQQGGSTFGITAGTVPGSAGSGGGNVTCTVEIDVVATQPDRYDNTTSGVASDQTGDGPASNTAALRVVPGTSGAPLACDSQWYYSSGSSSSTRLYRLDRAGTPYAGTEFSGAGYAPTSGHSHDALGLNPIDGYLYAVVRDSSSGGPATGSLLRIDAAGEAINLGRPVQGPQRARMPASSTFFTGGAFTADGTYLVVTDDNATAPPDERSRILGIDVSTSPPQVVSNVPHGRAPNDIAVHPDGTVWAYAPDGALFTIDPATGTTADIGTGAATGVQAQFMDASGRLGVRDAAGTVHTVDLATAQTTVVAAGAAGNVDDGASCAFGMAFEKRNTSGQSVGGGRIGYAFDIFNGSDAAVAFDLSDTLADGRTFADGTLVVPPALGGAPNAYAGTDTLDLQGLLIEAASSATVTIEAAVPPSTAAGPLLNRATLSGLPAGFGGTLASDDPSTPAFGDPTAADNVGSAILGIAKQATINPADPREVVLDFRLENHGSVELTDLSVPDDLDAVFGAGNYTVAIAPLIVGNDDPGTVAVNPGFSDSDAGGGGGSGSGTDLLDPANSSLAAGDTVHVRTVVRIDTITDRGSGPGFYSNQVSATAQDPLGGTVSDLSDSGAENDGDGDGDPTESVAGGGDADENEATVFTVGDPAGPAPPPVALTKTVVDLNGDEVEPGDRLRYTIGVDNALTTPVTDLGMTDELPASIENVTLVGVPPGATAELTPAPGGANGTGRLVVSGLDVAPNTGVEIVLEVSVVAGAATGTRIDNVADLEYPAGDDASASVSLTVRGGFLPAAGTKPLYLVGPTELSRVPLGSDSGPLPVAANGGRRDWTLDPALADRFTIRAGTAPVVLWLTGQADGDYPLRIDLSSVGTGGDTPIGTGVSRSVTLLAGVPRLVRFEIPVGSDTPLAAGERIRLTLGNDGGVGLSVTARRAGQGSRVEMDSDTVINVDAVEVLDEPAPDGAPRTVWYANETLHVRATISDPFGEADISDALVSVRDGDGNAVLVPTSMGAPIASTAGTRTYELAYTLPASVQPGDWRVAVRGLEGSEGTVSHASFADITVRQARMDFGDAPDAGFGTASGDYRTRLADDGPRHGVGAPVYLGAGVDVDADGAATGTEPDGDDNDGGSGGGGADGGDDEDGVIFTTPLAPGLPGNASVQAFNASGGPAYLNAWIDFDADGDFDGPGERVAADRVLATGTASLAFDVPAGAVIGASVARFRYSTQPGLTQTGEAGDGEVEDHALRIVVPGYTLLGRVFEDRDVDGSFGAGDSGVAGAGVVLRDEAAGTCESVRTRGDGVYLFYPVADGAYTLYESVGAAVPLPALCPPPGADPAGYLSVTPNQRAVNVAGGDIGGLDFGDVREPTLTGDGTASAEPGASVVYPHAFTAEADGRVEFALAASPVGAGGPAALHRDIGCDGRLDAGDPVLVSGRTLAAGERLCLLLKSEVASNASPGARRVDTLSASFTFADPAGLGHGLSARRRRQDVTTTTERGAGKLVLRKSVENASEGGAPSLTNAADTGDVLRYRVRFENGGSGALTELRINDATPAFTAIASPIACPATLPAGLAPCTVQVPAPARNVPGYQGLLEWRFGGALAAGARGELGFDVEVE